MRENYLCGFNFLEPVHPACVSTVNTLIDKKSTTFWGNWLLFPATEDDWVYQSAKASASFVPKKAIVRIQVKVPVNVFFDEITLRPAGGCYINCSGNGRCIYGHCECYPGFRGQGCEINK